MPTTQSILARVDSLQRQAAEATIALHHALVELQEREDRPLGTCHYRVCVRSALIDLTSRGPALIEACQAAVLAETSTPTEGDAP